MRLSQEEETFSADVFNEKIIRIENMEVHCCKESLSNTRIDKVIKNMFPNIVDIKYVIEADMFNKNRHFYGIYVSVIFLTLFISIKTSFFLIATYSKMSKTCYS